MADAIAKVDESVEVTAAVGETSVEALVSASGGVTQWISLIDTPNSYSGQAGKLTKVNGDEDALEFFTIADVFDPIYLRIDGTNAMAATLDMDTNLISNVVDPVDNQDAATKKYVDDAVEVENLWDRSGTTLRPHTSGDDVIADGGLTIGIGAAGVDYTLIFDGETNDGLLTWKEDEDYFEFNDDILMNGTESIYFRDTDLAIWSSADSVLNIKSNDSVAVETVDFFLENPTGTDLRMIFDGTGANQGIIEFQSDNHQFRIPDNVLFDVAAEINFRDSDLAIWSSIDGQLDIKADSEVQIATGTFDLNATTFTTASGIECESDGLLISSLRDFWAFKFKDGLGSNDTGMFFSLTDGEVQFKTLGIPLFSFSAFGDYAEFGTAVDFEFRFVPLGTNSGLFTWKEDEDYFLFDDDIVVPTLFLNDGGNFASFTYNDSISLVTSDKAINITAGILSLANKSTLWDNSGVLNVAFSTSYSSIILNESTTIGRGAIGVDYSLTFNGQTNDGVFTWMEDEDYFEFADTIKSSGGRISQTTRVTSTPYAVLASDEILFIDTDSAAITVNLPVGGDGRHYRVTNTGSVGNPVTLAPNGAENLFGANANQTIFDGETLNIYFESSEGWW